ncbi:MAG: hypothetical protein HOP15_12270 [Planctomycetes bacterium]|nr:hypothetical protein [Planctomycetota bacterium]
MKLYLLKLSLGTALALASFASGPDEVRYAPEKGLKVTRTCETSGEFELESESVTVDGEERPVPGNPSGSLSIEEKTVVSDELVAVGSGRPEKLARTFDELHKQQTISGTGPDGEVMEQTQKLTCDLEGKRVVFTSNADDKRFDVQAAADQKLDAELLDGLDEDMDLRAFLPDKPVAKGDSWDVEPAAFHAVLWPGGRLPFHDADKHEPDAIEHELNAALYASLDGDAKVTYAGQREEDGVKVFVLHVKADLSRTGESVPSSEYTSEHGGTPGTKVKLEFTTQAEGDLLWSVEHAHLISLTLEGKATVTQGVSYPVRGQLVEQVKKFSGTTRYSFAVERGD